MEYIDVLKLELNVSTKESEFYRKLNSTMLLTESITKSRRYGRDFYVKNYLKNSDSNITSYMNTFVYLRDAELSANQIKNDAIKELNKYKKMKETINVK